ncbi:MAG: EcsC family protein [Chitinophagaceae bacterium]
MDSYDYLVLPEVEKWQRQMLHKPSFLNRLSRKAQGKINSWIPEKVHAGVTYAIKQMVTAVLFGARYTTSAPLRDQDLKARELLVEEKIRLYRNTAAVEGGITGAGGILMGLADFPLLMAIKIKLLFEIASVYGFDTRNYKERIYILYIFELAFSSHEHRRNVYLKMTDWDKKATELPDDLNQFEWRSFQQEYRDYIDLAKMAQLVPVIGAPVGVIANYRLIRKLGLTAKNAYRMRLLNSSNSGTIKK